MSTYSTLVDRGNIRGSSTRPYDNDGWPPSGGTVVSWVLAQPVQDMLDQGKALGWTNSGTIGNYSHLQKHGDHTPWSGGKVRGIVYAKDTSEPSWVEAALVKLCRSDYDTRWIDFFNINGSQYNYAGQRVASSGDYHLHISVREGYELTRVTLFTDLDKIHRGESPIGDDVSAKDVWQTDGLVPAPRVDEYGNPVDVSGNEHYWPANYVRQISEDGRKFRGEVKARQDAQDAEIAAVKASLASAHEKLDTLSTGGLDPADVAARVDALLAARLAE